MEEEIKQAQESEEVLPQEEPVLEEAEAANQENVCPPEQGENPVQGKKKKSLKEIIEYIKTHENLRQPILFFLFSMICGASQMLITLVLPMILRAASPSMNESFSWFLFDYTEKGLGEFIGFLVGSVVGQALTFILNRKKTFNVKDHVAFRAIAYAVMAVLIILMQTAIGGGITGALAKADPGATGIVAAIYNIIAQVVAGIAAFVVNFLGNKFFIMRKFGKAKEAEQAEKSLDSEVDASSLEMTKDEDAQAPNQENLCPPECSEPLADEAELRDAPAQEDGPQEE